MSIVRDVVDKMNKRLDLCVSLEIDKLKLNKKDLKRFEFHFYIAPMSFFNSNCKDHMYKPIKSTIKSKFTDLGRREFDKLVFMDTCLMYSDEYYSEQDIYNKGSRMPDPDNVQKAVNDAICHGLISDDKLFKSSSTIPDVWSLPNRIIICGYGAYQ